MVRLKVSVKLTEVIVSTLLCEMFHKRTDTGKDAGIGKLFSQQLMGMLVHPEEQGYITFSQNVAQDCFIVSLWKVMVEQGFAGSDGDADFGQGNEGAI